LKSDFVASCITTPLVPDNMQQHCNNICDNMQNTASSSYMMLAACCQEIFLISQEIFKEKQDIKNEA
jgi:hypothetical protein